MSGWKLAAGLALLGPAIPALAAEPALKARPASVALALKTGPSRLAEQSFVYVPKNITVPAPLVVLLHGAGGDALHVLGRYTAAAERRGVIFLAQQSTDVTWRINASANGSVEFGPDPEKIDRALGALFAQAPVDPSRIVVFGFSDGASYALSLGLANPQLFRTIVALSPGYLWIPPRVDRSQRVFITHGRHDEILPFSNVVGTILPDLKKAGLRPRTRWFNGGHTVDEAMVSEALDFALGPPASP